MKFNRYAQTLLGYFESLVLETLESNHKFKDLDIKIEFVPKTKSKIWKEVYRVWVNGVRGTFGSNNHFKDFSDTGYSLGLNIPGIGNDTLNPDRIELIRHILRLLQSERKKRGLSTSARETFNDLF